MFYVESRYEASNILYTTLRFKVELRLKNPRGVLSCLVLLYHHIGPPKDQMWAKEINNRAGGCNTLPDNLSINR